MSHDDRHVMDHQFDEILKDQEQKSDMLRDKIHAENKLKKEEILRREEKMHK